MKNSTPTPPTSLNLSYLQTILQKNGPDPKEYNTLNSWIQNTYDRIQNGELHADAVKPYICKGEGIFSTQTIQGYMLVKPHGYAGDFMMIDKIYKKEFSQDPRFVKWDLFNQERAAPRAVRNRKTYFKQLVKSLASQKEGPFTILNLASGPCRDLFELFEENPELEVQVDCVELDPNAIEYAQALLGRHNDKVRFSQKNIFRFQSPQQYDLVWSAGLFDYFEDKTFVRILARLLQNVQAVGELVIGNFHPRNPTRAFMELFGEWFLHHRTDEELTQLALDAGVPDVGQIRIESEKEGINLFMRIKKT
jgi:extracellular factor (EF) 3-hydroxypalmitic acid methyl ester biosynthesis protein